MKRFNNETCEHPIDITENIANLIPEIGEKEKQDIENCLYEIRTIAENEYNCDYWRTFYTALSLIFEY